MPDLTVDALNQMNAQQAQQHAESDKDEVVRLLRANCVAAATIVRRLTDLQLDSSTVLSARHPIRVFEPWVGERPTTRDLIESLLIGHISEHGSSVLAAAFPALARDRQRESTGVA